MPWPSSPLFSSSLPLPCLLPPPPLTQRSSLSCHHGNQDSETLDGSLHLRRLLAAGIVEGLGPLYMKAHHSSGEGLPQPRLEEEIDSLARELALKEKEAGHPRLTAQPLPEAAQKLLEPAATLGFSQWGQQLEPGLPSTHGTSLPTPHTSLSARASSGPVQMSPLEPQGRGNGLALVLILAFCLASTAALAVAALCWCRLQREIRLTQKADYTATAKGPTSPTTPRISPGDERLVHSAEMYHYQHQRQQMLCLERHKDPPKELESASSDEENEDGDFTVYECPGLAPTGEMEVRNPLFDHSTLSAPVPGPHSSPPLQ